MTDFVFPMPREIEAKTTPLLGAYFFQELTLSISKATDYICAIQYQWKWNIHERFSKVQMLGAEIAKARARNVNLFIILNQEGPNRNLTKINAVSSHQLENLGCNIKLLRTISILHTKLWIIDNKYCFVGSHNISGRSLTINEEVSVKIESEPFAIFMKEYFDNLWGSR